MDERESLQSSARREAWLRLGVGGAQAVLATAVVASSIIHVPTPVVLVLLALTLAMIGVSLLRWRMR